MNYEEGKVGDRVEIGGHYGNIVAIEPNDCCLPYIVKWDELPEPMRVLHTQLRKVENARAQGPLQENDNQL